MSIATTFPEFVHESVLDAVTPLDRKAKLFVAWLDELAFELIDEGSPEGSANLRRLADSADVARQWLLEAAITFGDAIGVGSALPMVSLWVTGADASVRRIETPEQWGWEWPRQTYPINWSVYFGRDHAWVMPDEDGLGMPIRTGAVCVVPNTPRMLDELDALRNTPGAVVGVAQSDAIREIREDLLRHAALTGDLRRKGYAGSVLRSLGVGGTFRSPVAFLRALRDGGTGALSSDALRQLSWCRWIRNERMHAHIEQGADPQEAWAWAWEVSLDKVILDSGRGDGQPGLPELYQELCGEDTRISEGMQRIYARGVANLDKQDTAWGAARQIYRSLRAACAGIAIRV